jgi:hypothetical protein
MNRPLAAAALFLLAAAMFVRLLVRTAALMRCQRRGHDWQQTPTGLACRRCPRRLHEGDRI